MVIPELEIGSLCESLRKAGKKIVFTNGCFDLLHAGHARYLTAAAKFGDCLIVGLNSDSSVRALKGAQRPIHLEADRAELLDALKPVSYVVVFSETTAAGLIESIKPDVYVKGGDYTAETLPEAPSVAACGGEIRFVPFLEGRSSTKIIGQIKAARENESQFGCG